MADNEECPMCNDDQIGGKAAVVSHLIEWVDLKEDIFIITVQESEKHPQFSYTIGMEKNFHTPEIVVYGLPTKSAHAILNTIKDMVGGGWDIEIDKKVPGIAHDYDTVFKEFPVERVEGVFNLALWYYRDHSFRTIQAIWPDEHNIFPWEEGYDEKFREFQRMP